MSRSPSLLVCLFVIALLDLFCVNSLNKSACAVHRLRGVCAATFACPTEMASFLREEADILVQTLSVFNDHESYMRGREEFHRESEYPCTPYHLPKAWL